MNIGHPILALSTAWVKARDFDLPDVTHEWQGRKRITRPNEDSLDYRVFSQNWPNTAGGMDAGGGVAGQAFSTAPTVVVMHENAACVYFNGRLAYRVAKMGTAFREDLRSSDLVSQRHAAAKYGAEIA